MKYYSETLEKLFDTEKELEAAEIASKKELEDKRAAEEAAKKEKQELLDKIDAAKEKLHEATAEYDKVVQEYNDKYSKHQWPMNYSDLINSLFIF